MKPGRPDATPPKREYPSPFQRKTLWTAITGAALLGTGAMSVYTVSVVARVLQFLQPVLVPVAFAGILAYLLQPLVDRLVKRGTPRFRAMMWVWIMFHLLILLLFLSVAVPAVPAAAQGALELVHQRGDACRVARQSGRTSQLARIDRRPPAQDVAQHVPKLVFRIVTLVGS